ncbi:hypothetical protein ABT294_01510 [Nonomuraea sp. NPDC000554]|uniref:hypothetical protein n=1 Tax=Nonomuraea sp. NPDC000554 TaxID=3154259 RepID=UPI00332C8825
MGNVTELLGQSVWDSNGVWVGQVVDIRVIKNKGELQQAQTICGLVVSGRRGPLLRRLTGDRQGSLGWLAELLARVFYVGCTFVPWTDVIDYSGGEVHISTTRNTLTRA